MRSVRWRACVVLRLVLPVLLLIWGFGGAGPARADLEPVSITPQTGLEKYVARYKEQLRSSHPLKGVLTKPKKKDVRPGWVLGEFATPPGGDWPFREVTWEAYFADRSAMGSMIYGLAVFTRDLDRSVELARFQKGVQGFHYSTQQVVDWANARETGEFPKYAEEEQVLIERLVADGVLVRSETGFSAGTEIRHVVGAASGKKRNLDLNLAHERLHILWDEDPAFRDAQTTRWRDMTGEEKETVYAQLKGYSRENEKQIIEEWAVRAHEETPAW